MPVSLRGEIAMADRVLEELGEEECLALIAPGGEGGCPSPAR